MVEAVIQNVGESGPSRDQGRKCYWLGNYIILLEMAVKINRIILGRRFSRERLRIDSYNCSI
jgi:hypothetical protein